MFQIYPGKKMWLKRIGYTIILSSIGFNFYVSRLQNHLYKQSSQIIDQVDPFVQRASKLIGGASNHVVPGIKRLEEKVKKEALEHNFDWVPQDFQALPYESIQTRSSHVQALHQSINHYQSVSQITALILKWMNIAMWFPIGLTLIWFFHDLKKSKYPVITWCCLILAGISNYHVYQFLQQLWSV